MWIFNSCKHRTKKKKHEQLHSQRWRWLKTRLSSLLTPLSETIMEPSVTLRFRSHTLSLFPHAPISSIDHPHNHLLIPISPKFSSNTTLSVAATAKKKPSIEGVSEELNAMASQNLDFAPSRRRVRAAFTEVHQQLDHFLFKVSSNSSWLQIAAVSFFRFWNC